MKKTRKHERYSYIASAAIRMKSGVDEPVTVMVNNISLGGMAVFIENPCELNTDVTVEVNFISMYGSETKDVVEGKVTNIMQRDDLYLMGISFNDDLNPENQPNIYELFNDSIKDK